MKERARLRDAKTGGGDLIWFVFWLVGPLQLAIRFEIRAMVPHSIGQRRIQMLEYFISIFFCKLKILGFTGSKSNFCGLLDS